MTDYWTDEPLKIDDKIFLARYLANDTQSEWAARARRSLKFCEMQIHLSPASMQPRAPRTAAMTRIEGFWVYWGGEHYVWAEREVAPNHRYRFEVSADWKQIGRFWMSPVDVAGADAVKDAERFAKKARGAVEEFLLLGREGY